VLAPARGRQDTMSAIPASGAMCYISFEALSNVLHAHTPRPGHMGSHACCACKARRCTHACTATKKGPDSQWHFRPAHSAAIGSRGAECCPAAGVAGRDAPAGGHEHERAQHVQPLRATAAVGTQPEYRAAHRSAWHATAHQHPMSCTASASGFSAVNVAKLEESRELRARHSHGNTLTSQPVLTGRDIVPTCAASQAHWGPSPTALPPQSSHR
jgi:hypothetical protein